jgi:hypothetical protein
MDAGVLKMRPDFPGADLDEVVKQAGVLDEKYRAQHSGQPCEEWRGFIAAYHGTKTRFRAMTEAEETYAKTVPQSNETRENGFVQDSALFSFFTNAVSVLEVLCYACFSLAAQLQPSAFPMTSEKALRSVTPEFTLDRFELLYPQEPLTGTLRELRDDPALKELLNARNVLSHRGNPPRNYNVTLDFTLGASPQHKFIGGAKGDPPKWHGIVLDDEALSQRRAWLVEYVKRLVGDLLTFSKNNIGA